MSINTISSFIAESLGEFTAGFLLGSIFFVFSGKKKSLKDQDSKVITTSNNQECTQSPRDMRRYIEDELTNEYLKSLNWKRKQNIEIILLWLSHSSDNLLESEDFNSFKIIDDKLLEIIKFPTQLRFDSAQHLQFAESVAKEYNKILINAGAYRDCMFKPESLLPFPKPYIGDAIEYLIQHSKIKTGIINDLSGIKLGLIYFINVSENELPIDVIENKKIGIQYLNMT